MKLLIILLTNILLFGDVVQDFLNKDYGKVCKSSRIKYYAKNEKILSLIGTACVKSDKLVLLPYVIQGLRKTETGRKNAIYFLTIYTQKRLLYSFLFDNFSLDGFFLPNTDYILSKVFYAFKRKNYKIVGDKYEIDLNNSKIFVYKYGDKMMVDEIKNGNLIKRWYR